MNLKKLFARIAKSFKSSRPVQAATPTIPQQPPAPLTGGLIFASDFMPDQKFSNTFCILAARMTDTQREAAIKYLVGSGYAMAHVCPAIDGFGYDGTEARKWLSRIRAAGLQICLWFDAGNNKFGQRDYSEAKFNECIQRAVTVCDDLVDCYCIGIEVDEYGWSASRVSRHVDFARGLAKKRVAVHTASRAVAYFANADIAFLQYGFSTNARDIASYTQAVMRFTNRPVVAMEYHRDGASEAAKAFGQAAMEAGASGFGNGGTIGAIIAARQRAVARTASGDTAPLSIEPPSEDIIPLDVMSAVGFREGAKLPFIGSMQVTQTLTEARSNGRVVIFSPSNPFGEGAWLCGAWREGDKWYWSDMEGLHAGASSQNYANNLFPVPAKHLPGRCREKDGTAHYPRRGEPLYVFLADNRLMRRTNIMYSGIQS